MPMIETFPVGVNEYILLPKQGTFSPPCDSKTKDLANIQALFEPDYLLTNNLVSHTASGRGTVYFFEAMREQCVLRHYYRGGLVAKISDDHFIFNDLKSSRPYRELSLLSELYAAGLNVAKPLAARVKRKRTTYTADIITGTIENADELHAHISQQPLDPKQWAKIGVTLRQMHDLQACHYDINVKNVLLQKNKTEMQVYLLDFDGCKKRRGERWKYANLMRFKRSLDKQKAKHSPYYFDQTCWAAVITGYNATTNPLLRRNT